MTPLIGIAFARIVFSVFIALPLPALALDINAFRAQHPLPPPGYSAAFAGAAQAHASDLAAH